MKSLSRKERMVENEVIFRSVNKNMQEFMEKDAHAKASETLAFYCECANPDCRQRIKLSLRRYSELHKNKKHFVVLVGHEFPEVEKIISRHKGYQRVEKHFTPPQEKDIDMALKSINSSSAIVP